MKPPRVLFVVAFGARVSGAGRTSDTQVASSGKGEPGGSVEKC